MQRGVAYSRQVLMEELTNETRVGMAWVVEAAVAVPNGGRKGDGGGEGRGGRQRGELWLTGRTVWPEIEEVAPAGRGLGVDAAVRSRGRGKGREMRLTGAIRP